MRKVITEMERAERLYTMEALVEDRSGSLILAGVLQKMLAALPPTAPRWSFFLRPHRGIGELPPDWNQKPLPYTANLLGLLPARLRGYRQILPPEGPDLVLVVCDSDRKDPVELYNKIRQMARVQAGDLPLIIGLAIEELEAWILGDEAAILAAFPDADRLLLRTYEQDSICGTWEVLARMILKEQADDLIETGYPAVGMYKSQWAAGIAPYLEPERNRSPSFQRFRRALTAALNKPRDRVEESRRWAQLQMEVAEEKRLRQVMNDELREKNPKNRKKLRRR